MPNSRPRALLLSALAVAASLSATAARAQKVPQGFSTERLYLSAPGGGWFVMDDLDMHGGLGGAVALTTGYARNPLRISDSRGSFAVVSDQAFIDFGFALTYYRFRLYLSLDAPLVVTGQSGSVGDFEYVAPSVGLGSTPDTLGDARIGTDVRLWGGPRSPLRLGVGAQLLVPVGSQTNYVNGSYVGSNYQTDGTYRGMLRLLGAGDVGRFTYAAQFGVHVRPLDDGITPGSPRGSELLFGVAAGSRLRVGHTGATAVVLGPEVFGESALRSLFGGTTTGVEGLMTARVEGTADDGPQLRLKLGAGGGLDAQFGAPEWRLVLGLELFDRGTDRDHDGVTNQHDACPDRAGIRTRDPATIGCPEVTPSPP